MICPIHLLRARESSPRVEVVFSPLEAFYRYVAIFEDLEYGYFCTYNKPLFVGKKWVLMTRRKDAVNKVVCVEKWVSS